MINSSRLTVNLLKNSKKNFLKFSTINFSTVGDISKDFNNNNNNHGKNSKQNFYYDNRIKVLLALAGLGAGGIYKLNKNEAYCEENHQSKKSSDEPGKFLEDLPIYTEDDVLQHGKDADRIWVSYKEGVYDITNFVESHPGGEKILLAAGSSLEPFWSIYAVHKEPGILKMLEKFRIGNLKRDKVSNENTNDPFQHDPKRHPLLKVLTKKPFNAEMPKELACENLITPNELHFVRNHLPVPIVDITKFELEIENELDGKKYKFNFDELTKRFPVHTIPVTLQCSGNKRKFMNEYDKVQGLMWDVNAISTAEWTGVKLRDLLQYCGINLNDSRIKHIKFEGLDKDPITGTVYGASIPKEKAFDEAGDVLVAFKMNGVDLPLDFGFPIRVIVPGVIGARSVKWLKKISISQEESKSFWQTNDYKVLPPSVKNLKEADFSKYNATQEMPVQSAICEPVNGDIIEKSDGSFTIKGYAYSGGGKSIDSVNVSVDNGKTWKTADLRQNKRPFNRNWAWALWELEVDIPTDRNEIEIICVATDSARNTQPESVKSIWNARGLMNNAYHKINIQLK